jgi:glutathione synthase/RimK-type ligase-like ATP-grasp enzyme
MTRCLLIGSKGDPHVSCLVEHLAAAGVESDVLDILRAPKITQTVSNGKNRITINERPLAEYDVIVTRMKWRIDPQLATEEGFSKFFYVQEWLQCLRGLIATAKASGLKVVGDPVHQAWGANKVWQLSLAGDCGLTLPDTVITTSPADLRASCASWASVIGKVFDSAFVPAMHNTEALTIPTAELTQADLAALAEEIGHNPPLIVQEKVAKAWEARLILSQKSALCYAIDSQAHALSATDWRMHEVGARYQLTEVPDEILAAARQLLERLDLDYGVFDFAVTPEGRWVFFECNPDGQWWVPRRKAGGRPESVLGDLILDAISEPSCRKRRQ